ITLSVDFWEIAIDARHSRARLLCTCIGAAESGSQVATSLPVVTRPVGNIAVSRDIGVGLGLAFLVVTQIAETAYAQRTQLLNIILSEIGRRTGAVDSAPLHLLPVLSA